MSAEPSLENPLVKIIYVLEPSNLANALNELPAFFGKSPQHAHALESLLLLATLAGQSAQGLESLQRLVAVFQMQLLVASNLGELVYCHSTCKCKSCAAARLLSEAVQEINAAEKETFLRYYQHYLKQCLADDRKPEHWADALEIFRGFDPDMRSHAASKHYWTYWKPVHPLLG